MIYLDEPYFDDGHPPMAGTRVGHEMLSEDVIEIRVDHAEQSFRSARRTLSMLDVVGGGEPEPGDDLYRELMDWGHKTAGRRPLVSP